MKIIPFRKKGRVYELLDEIDLDRKQHGIQVIGSGIRVFISQRSSKLVIKIPDVTTRLRTNPDEREFILSKKRKAREET